MKNNIKFLMDTDWLFSGVMDSEHKEYVLLSFFQKINKNLDEMKLYPTFTEITLHLANIQNIIKYKKMLYCKKKLVNLDDEISIHDLKEKEIPILDEKETEQLENILDYSFDKLQSIFDTFKSAWTVVFDTIEIVSILNEDNIQSKKGYFYIKYEQNIKIWEYSLRQYKGETRIKYVENNDYDLFMFLVSKENKFPTFYVHTERDYPLYETILPICKRKIASYILQTKNITTT
jgi:hypothetical protein